MLKWENVTGWLLLFLQSLVARVDMRDVSYGLNVLHSSMVDDFEENVRSDNITPELVR
jgi:hypothetical protein